jgi:predicted nucleotidyltransferase
MDALRTLDRLRSKRREIFEILDAYGASNPRVVGSVARGEDGPDSDIDLLLDMPHDLSLLDVIAIQQDLEDLLGTKIQVMEEAAIPEKILNVMRVQAATL